VTFTLTLTSVGTHLRMEQSGSRPDQKQAYGGSKAGWLQFFASWIRSWRGQIKSAPNGSRDPLLHVFNGGLL
jgi:hypothetical protein